jgi:hypothetical protein
MFVMRHSNMQRFPYRNILHTKNGTKETCEHLRLVLGECCISCEIELAGPEYECQQGLSSIPESIAEKCSAVSFQSWKMHQKLRRLV